MSGGTWTVQNKVRPGVYINTVSEKKALGARGERGVVSMPMALSWGQPKQVIEINAESNLLSILGYAGSSSELLLVRETLKRASSLLLYRLNTGTKASATIGTLEAEALHGGARGNDITISITTNIDTPSLFDVKTFVEGVERDKQSAAAADELKANDWVVFRGTGALAAAAGKPLTGGADGSVAQQDYLDYLAAIEVHDFSTIGLTSNDSATKSVFAAFVKRQREQEGKKIQVVLENYHSADDEGVISVKNGVVLRTGETLTAAQAVAWVAGATAGAAPNQSLTYDFYEDAVDVSPRYTHNAIIEALQNGEFLFTAIDGRVVVEQDINTLRTYTQTKTAQFSKNRVIRVLDGLANDYLRVFSKSYIGKVSNNADGRNLFKGELINITQQYQDAEAIQGFDSQTDLDVQPGQSGDSILVNQWVQPVDSIEKIYMTVTVR